MDTSGIIEALKRLGVPHSEIADAIGRDRTAATKMLAGVRSIKAAEVEPLSSLIAKYERDVGDHAVLPRNPKLAEELEAGRIGDYVPVEVLPTFAGMGGGGTGDADRATALMPLSLVVNDLRAQASDLLLIEVRGDSMHNPETGKGFMHGDQILIDKRDTNPRQPGAFALWYDDGYVVKNVEILRKLGRLRIFSNNPAYSDEEADPADVRIMGRPVWFARRL